MSGFAADWLALREPADHRARDAALAHMLQSYFLQRDHVAVVDLGCGTGSNLRATAPLLPARQTWTLVDHDEALLGAAREALANWADTVEPAGDGDALRLVANGRTIDVTFRQADLVTGLDGVLSGSPALVTASALFDLASEAFIGRFAKAVAETGAAFYTVLTYNGIQRWSPRGPLDQQMASAFIGHQMTDKGFGIASGPLAPEHLAGAFRGYGYLVSEGDSPWRLTASADAPLINELATGFARAVRETRKVAVADIDKWLARTFSGAEVGHTDTLALPGSNVVTSIDG